MIGPMKLSEKLEKKLVEFGWSRPEMARRTGIPYTTLMGYFQGGHPGPKNLDRLASALKVSVEYLTDESCREESKGLGSDEELLLSHYRYLRDQFHLDVHRALLGLKAALDLPPSSVMKELPVSPREGGSGHQANSSR